ncbi:MAG: toprim domain-containing protein [Verrucomicrobiota bacterium]
MAEGESDAITLIFNGFEQPFSGEDSTAVIAIPSATTFKAEWSPLFGGKNVALLFDNDAAGELASERVGKLISPHARKVQSLDWKEVTV